MNHTATPWIVIGENCGGGCNIGIEFLDSKGIKRELVFARTVAVRNPVDLHGRAPIEAEEAAANARRLVEALNQCEQVNANDRDIAFLREAAGFFEHADAMGEDRTFWANTYNAEACRRIADRLAGT